MGMHFGIVASHVPLKRLLGELNEAGFALRQVGELSRMDEAPDDNDESYVIAGELGGATYLLDKSMLISAGHADQLAAIAKRTGEVVVGCGAETVSATYLVDRVLRRPRAASVLDVPLGVDYAVFRRHSAPKRDGATTRWGPRRRRNFRCSAGTRFRLYRLA